MSAGLLLAGAVIVLATMTDFTWTTLSLRGAGPLTSFSSRALWAGFRTGSRWSGSRLPLLLGGPALLLVIMTTWFVLLWAGWTLLFLAERDAVLASPQNAPADLAERIYFVGFTLTTLGVGDFKPQGTLWQILTAIAALNGLTLITVAITYLLSVLSAVIRIRTFAAHVTALGDSPEEIVCNGWARPGFGPLTDQLNSLTPTLLHITQSQLAYPVLDVFQSARAGTAIGPAAARLGEALLLLEHGVAPGQRPAPSHVRPLRSGIDGLLAHLATRRLDEPPAPPMLAALREAGVPTVEDQEFRTALAEEAGRRCRLNAMVQDGGWSWNHVRACN